MKTARQVKQYLKKIYRFCDSPDEVNWNARRKPDTKFYETTVLPAELRFLESAVKQAAFSNETMNALIGLSGGLDSTVVAYLLAESMQQSMAKGRTKEANLALLHATGLEDSDTAGIIKDLESRFKDVRIRPLPLRLSDELSRLNLVVNDLSARLGGAEVPIPAELVTRLICQVTNETATRAGYVTVDTTNGTEYVLGEFTIGLGYQVVPLVDLWKSDVWELGEMLQVPQSVLERPPKNSAFSFTTKPELYFGKLPNGVTPRQAYEVLDPILHWLYVRCKSPQEVAHNLGHSEKFVQRVCERIQNQKYRREHPTFMTQSKRISFPSCLSVSDREVEEILTRSMPWKNQN